MNITLKDGSVKVYDAPMTAADITKDISMGSVPCSLLLPDRRPGAGLAHHCQRRLRL